LAEQLDDTIMRAVTTRHWQRLCVRYANGTEEDRRRINDVLGAGDRIHFELAWAATYGPKKPIPQPEPRLLWQPRWLQVRRMKKILAEIDGGEPDDTVRT
jgi:hypothetical protein